MPGPVSVDETHAVDDELVDAFQRLIPQLSRSNPSPTREELDEIVRSAASHLLVARDGDGRIVGSLTLVLFRIPTAVRAWIEDVVVDADAVRGKGLRTGEALTAAALHKAREAGAKTVELTSRPAREHANELYVRLGFERRDTNVYRYTLG